ncbi:zinc ribbon domain-containing protein [Bacillus sp. JJ1764]|uniref:zinc ribbon domain-containing protein n=1 Tax=Bacillus sp. JJ1764 TaxID=3122964 RepID=UPI002FFE06C8
MSVCRNCGQPLTPQQAFCKHCGTKNDIEPQTRAVGKKTVTLSAPVKWGIISILVVVVGLFSAHLYLSNQYKPEKAVLRFEDAVKDKDYASLHKILEQGGTETSLTDSELKGFVSYLTKKNDFKATVKQLRQDAAGTKHYKRIHPITDDYGNKLVVLVKGPKKFFLYDQYFVKAYPFTISASSNLDHTKVTFNKQTKMIKEADEAVTLGKVLPGNLTLNSVYKGEYTTLNSKTDVDYSEASNNKVRVSIYLKGKFITIYSNGDHADVYVNGKKTGFKTGTEKEFGPIPTNGTMEMYAVLDRDGGLIKSNVVKIEDEGEIDLEFKELAEEKQRAEQKERNMEALAMYGSDSTPNEQMHNFMEEFIAASVRAFNNRDFSLVSSYLAPQGSGYSATEKYISHLEEKGITEELLNLEILDVTTTEKGFTVKTREEYNIYYEDAPGKNTIFESTYNLEATDFGLRELSLENTKPVKSVALESDTDYE